ncbi:uncharacterized protein DUF4349 [Balneicella halophila]|uniref:Uncharacterized protein DUF4349 n=1 Tax=Balneicella halophila TaxID=1537566 RepID=A0A7L4UQN6_BALHA|nr:DUF4349 domain-containing protein [Balneicella halophila]PVX52088.1 uncharacterized protein DUF4349 [Balneicella halophila]
MKPIILSFLVSCLAMCSNPKSEFISVEDKEVYETSVAEADQSYPESSVDAEVQPSNQKLIKNGDLYLETDALDNTKSHLDSLVKKFDGYSSNEDFKDTDYQSSLNYTVRIPSATFDNFLRSLDKIEATVVRKQINTQDVTAKFVDLEMRLANKERYLERYKELLNRANSIKDILEIENHIRTIEEELESTKGQLKYLSSQVNYSTLNIHITQDKNYQYTPKRDSFVKRLFNSISKGWYVFVEFLLAIIVLWPFWIVLIVFLYFLIRHNRRRRRKRVQNY